MQISRASSLQSDINVTPFVDVCLVLLIIMMVITPMIVTGIPVHLPAGRTSQPFDPSTRQLPVTVNADATIYIDGTVLRREQLVGELQRRHEEHPDRPVLVRGDTSVKYGEIAAVVDTCRLAGFKDVSLATTTPPMPATDATQP
jgi:biopolymer transport protein ExbD